jgi:signal transduction histidine kinase/DNA-binding response OmpR family regulator
VTYRTFFQNCINSGLFPGAQANPQQWLSELELAHQNLPMVAEYQLEKGKWIEIRETRSESGSLIVTHLDISTLKQTQLSLENAVRIAEHANSARGRFLAMISHEIRTPLNGVLGLLQLMQDTELSTQQKLYIETAVASGQSLLTIISDILDFSKIDADKLELQVAPCQLRHMLKDLTQLFQFRVDEKSIRLRCDIDCRLPDWISVDGQRLRQVLVNLLGNAIKFTNYGEVHLRMMLTNNGSVRFMVEDTGIGIPVGEQQKIFSEFSTINHGESQKIYEGTGLGLAISYKLVSLMGGELIFKSQSEQGSQFWFDVPLIESAGPIKTASPFALPGKLQGSILLVDDSATNRLVAKAMLESVGLLITTANDGYQAIELCQSAVFDLILMDISMPGIDGLETTTQLKQLPNWRDTPLIAVTASAMPEDKQRFLDHGMSDYVEKPLDKQRLLQVIERYLTPSKDNHDAADEKGCHESEKKLALLDPGKVEQLAKDTSEAVLPELCQIFIQDATERLQELQQNCLDSETVERHLHTLGGSAALYGLVAFCQQARVLEQQCRDNCSVKNELTAFIALGFASLETLAKHLQERG